MGTAAAGEQWGRRTAKACGQCLQQWRCHSHLRIRLWRWSAQMCVTTTRHVCAEIGSEIVVVMSGATEAALPLLHPALLGHNQHPLAQSPYLYEATPQAVQGAPSSGSLAAPIATATATTATATLLLRRLPA